MEYSIGTFSAMTGISIYTLRFYEKENLIKPARKPNGRRYYTDDDIRWIDFIIRLKDTGMPLKEIQRYAHLRALGDSSLEQRMELLIRHRTVITDKMAQLEEHLKKLDDKIEFYQNKINQEA